MISYLQTHSRNHQEAGSSLSPPITTLHVLTDQEGTRSLVTYGSDRAANSSGGDIWWRWRREQQKCAAGLAAAAAAVDWLATHGRKRREFCCNSGGCCNDDNAPKSSAAAFASPFHTNRASSTGSASAPAINRSPLASAALACSMCPARGLLGSATSPRFSSMPSTYLLDSPGSGGS